MLSGTVLVMTVCLADEPSVCARVSDYQVYDSVPGCFVAGATAGPSYLTRHPEYGRVAKYSCTLTSDVEKTLERLLDQPA